MRYWIRGKRGVNVVTGTVHLLAEPRETLCGTGLLPNSKGSARGSVNIIPEVSVAEPDCARCWWADGVKWPQRLIDRVKAENESPDDI